MDVIKLCEICRSNNLVETHHIIKRKQAKYLENCKLNLINLCWDHHKGTYGVHGKYGHKFDQELKLEFKNKLEELWDKQYLTKEEINKVLQISDKPLNKLLKPLTLQKGKYVREDIIRQCMGGKLVIEEGAK